MACVLYTLVRKLNSSSYICFFFYGSLGLTREEGGTIVPGLVFYLFTFQIRVKGLYVYQLDQLTNCRVESSYTCLSALLPAIATCNCYCHWLVVQQSAHTGSTILWQVRNTACGLREKSWQGMGYLLNQFPKGRGTRMV